MGPSHGDADSLACSQTQEPCFLQLGIQRSDREIVPLNFGQERDAAE